MKTLGTGAAVVLLGAVLGCAQPLNPTGTTMPAAAGTPAHTPVVTVRSESGAETLRVTDTAALIDVRWPSPEAGDRHVIEILDPDLQLFEKHEQILDETAGNVVRFPLRGSYVGDYNIVGTWRLRVYRNSARVPALETTFQVLP